MDCFRLRQRFGGQVVASCNDNQEKAKPFRPSPKERELNAPPQFIQPLRPSRPLREATSFGSARSVTRVAGMIGSEATKHPETTDFAVHTDESSDPDQNHRRGPLREGAGGLPHATVAEGATSNP